MKYSTIISREDSHGYLRSKKQGLYLLKNEKFKVHSIYIGKTKKIALCDSDDNILHIITRATYQKYITPEISFFV